MFSVLVSIALSALTLGALEPFGTKFLPEGNVTTGIEGGTSATFTVGNTTYPLYFEGGAGEALQQVIADDLAEIFGHVKEIRFRARAVAEEGVTIISVGKYPVSYEATDDDMSLPFTHWFSFPGVRTLRPEALKDEFTRVVTYNGQKYLLVTKDLIKAYRTAWRQKQRNAEAYEKLDTFVSSLNDLAQGGITIDELPRSVPEMHYLEELSDEGLAELRSPQAIQGFARSFQRMTQVVRPSILRVFEREYYREAYDSNGWEDVPLSGKLYTELFFIEDGELHSSLWPLMYVGGEWKIYIIE